MEERRKAGKGVPNSYLAIWIYNLRTQKIHLWANACVTVPQGLWDLGERTEGLFLFNNRLWLFFCHKREILLSEWCSFYCPSSITPEWHFHNLKGKYFYAFERLFCLCSICTLTRNKKPWLPWKWRFQLHSSMSRSQIRGWSCSKMADKGTTQDCHLFLHTFDDQIFTVVSLKRDKRGFEDEQRDARGIKQMEKITEHQSGSLDFESSMHQTQHNQISLKVHFTHTYAHTNTHT